MSDIYDNPKKKLISKGQENGIEDKDYLSEYNCNFIVFLIQPKIITNILRFWLFGHFSIIVFIFAPNLSLIFQIIKLIQLFLLFE